MRARVTDTKQPPAIRKSKCCQHDARNVLRLTFSHLAPVRFIISSGCITTSVIFNASSFALFIRDGIEHESRLALVCLEMHDEHTKWIHACNLDLLDHHITFARPSTRSFSREMRAQLRPSGAATRSYRMRPHMVDLSTRDECLSSGKTYIYSNQCAHCTRRQADKHTRTLFLVLLIFLTSSHLEIK